MNLSDTGLNDKPILQWTVELTSLLILIIIIKGKKKIIKDMTVLTLLDVYLNSQVFAVNEHQLLAYTHTVHVNLHGGLALPKHIEGYQFTGYYLKHQSIKITDTQEKLQNIT